MVICNCISFTAITIFGIYIAVTSGKANSMDDLNIRRTTQILEDWQRATFTDITIRERGCRFDEEPVFERTWQGLELGCEIFDDWLDDPEILDYETWDSDYRCYPTDDGNGQRTYCD